ncbi:MAG TPA: hypothetical protein VFC78_05250, partial [Tepidisphaeraceae bacterium]|nr:hypothetical protein [Tepidisphaeraceae bacterium]
MELELQLRQAVMDAAARPEVRLAVELVYSDLQDAIDLRRPICATSGRCCRFEEFGHRLYVSTLELAKFMADGWAADPALPPNISQPARSAPAALPSVSLPVISTEVSDAQTSNTPPTTHNPQ